MNKETEKLFRELLEAGWKGITERTRREVDAFEFELDTEPITESDIEELLKYQPSTFKELSNGPAR